MAAIAIVLPADESHEIGNAFDEGRAAERILIAAGMLELGAGIAWIQSGVRGAVGEVLDLPARPFHPHDRRPRPPDRRRPPAEDRRPAAPAFRVRRRSSRNAGRPSRLAPRRRQRSADSLGMAFGGLLCDPLRSTRREGRSEHPRNAGCGDPARRPGSPARASESWSGFAVSGIDALTAGTCAETSRHTPTISSIRSWPPVAPGSACRT